MPLFHLLQERPIGMLRFVPFFLALVMVAACTPVREQHYWQRMNHHSAMYLTGPKAQQTLEEDITKCVHSVIELSQIQEVRRDVPQNSLEHGDQINKLDNLPAWDAPQRIRNLHVNHSDYHDFESCMAHEGWERVRYVHPKTERRARETYEKTEDWWLRREVFNNQYSDGSDNNALNN